MRPGLDVTCRGATEHDRSLKHPMEPAPRTGSAPRRNGSRAVSGTALGPNFSKPEAGLIAGEAGPEAEHPWQWP